jgi:hypothetical protein
VYYFPHCVANFCTGEDAEKTAKHEAVAQPAAVPAAVFTRAWTEVHTRQFFAPFALFGCFKIMLLYFFSIKMPAGAFQLA